DEISEISQEIQVKLLRAIQEREFERVGGMKTLEVDVRLVAATNLDLAQEVDQRRFRRDLFYRLNVVPIQLPALRERIDDIPPLVDYFLIRMNQRLNRSIAGVTPDAMKALLEHSWPGNIRELENVIERAVLLCSDAEISAAILNLKPLKENRSSNPSEMLNNGVSFKKIIQEETDRVERVLLVNALTKTGGNVTRAAKQLGLSRKGLQLKMHRLEINPRNLTEMPDFS
ncbi:sigma 54-interacting transcriptional regulator, partial [bacterium]|nr:sigma 54-interacting transcriptional regulator [bacterium]